MLVIADGVRTIMIIGDMDVRPSAQGKDAVKFA